MSATPSGPRPDMPRPHVGEHNLLAGCCVQVAARVPGQYKILIDSYSTPELDYDVATPRVVLQFGRDDLVQVLEVEVSAAGQQRGRTDSGWVSLVDFSGTELCKLVTASSPNMRMLAELARRTFARLQMRRVNCAFRALVNHVQSSKCRALQAKLDQALSMLRRERIGHRKDLEKRDNIAKTYQSMTAKYERTVSILQKERADRGAEIERRATKLYEQYKKGAGSPRGVLSVPAELLSPQYSPPLLTPERKRDQYDLIAENQTLAQQCERATSALKLEREDREREIDRLVARRIGSDVVDKQIAMFVDRRIRRHMLIVIGTWHARALQQVKTMRQLGNIADRKERLALRLHFMIWSAVVQAAEREREIENSPLFSAAWEHVAATGSGLQTSSGSQTSDTSSVCHEVTPTVDRSRSNNAFVPVRTAIDTAAAKLAKRVARQVDLQVEQELSSAVKREQMIAQLQARVRQKMTRKDFKALAEAHRNKLIATEIDAERLRTTSVQDAMATMESKVAISVKEIEEKAASDLQRKIATAIAQEQAAALIQAGYQKFKARKGLRTLSTEYKQKMHAMKCDTGPQYEAIYSKLVAAHEPSQQQRNDFDMQQTKNELDTHQQAAMILRQRLQASHEFAVAQIQEQAAAEHKNVLMAFETEFAEEIEARDSTAREDAERHEEELQWLLCEHERLAAQAATLHEHQLREQSQRHEAALGETSAKHAVDREQLLLKHRTASMELQESASATLKSEMKALQSLLHGRHRMELAQAEAAQASKHEVMMSERVAETEQVLAVEHGNHLVDIEAEHKSELVSLKSTLSVELKGAEEENKRLQLAHEDAVADLARADSRHRKTLAAHKAHLLCLEDEWEERRRQAHELIIEEAQKTAVVLQSELEVKRQHHESVVSQMQKAADEKEVVLQEIHLRHEEELRSVVNGHAVDREQLLLKHRTASMELQESASATLKSEMKALQSLLHGRHRMELAQAEAAQASKHEVMMSERVAETEQALASKHTATVAHLEAEKMELTLAEAAQASKHEVMMSERVAETEQALASKHAATVARLEAEKTECAQAHALERAAFGESHAVALAEADADATARMEMELAARSAEHMASISAVKASNLAMLAQQASEFMEREKVVEANIRDQYARSISHAEHEAELQLAAVQAKHVTEMQAIDKELEAATTELLAEQSMREDDRIKLVSEHQSHISDIQKKASLEIQNIEDHHGTTIHDFEVTIKKMEQSFASEQGDLIESHAAAMAHRERINSEQRDEDLMALRESLVQDHETTVEAAEAALAAAAEAEKQMCCRVSAAEDAVRGAYLKEILQSIQNANPKAQEPVDGVDGSFSYLLERSISQVC
eukprot:SAG31_NODE_729_length_12511_cov_7.059293_7_plen_1355_part_00